MTLANPTKKIPPTPKMPRAFPPTAALFAAGLLEVPELGVTVTIVFDVDDESGVVTVVVALGPTEAPLIEDDMVVEVLLPPPERVRGVTLIPADEHSALKLLITPWPCPSEAGKALTTQSMQLWRFWPFVFVHRQAAAVHVLSAFTAGVHIDWHCGGNEFGLSWPWRLRSA